MESKEGRPESPETEAQAKRKATTRPFIAALPPHAMATSCDALPLQATTDATRLTARLKSKIGRRECGLGAEKIQALCKVCMPLVVCQGRCRSGCKSTLRLLKQPPLQQPGTCANAKKLNTPTCSHDQALHQILTQIQK